MGEERENVASEEREEPEATSSDEVEGHVLDPSAADPGALDPAEREAVRDE